MIQRVRCDECLTSETTGFCSYCRGSEIALIIDDKEQLVWTTGIDTAYFQQKQSQRLGQGLHVAMALMVFLVSVGLIGWYILRYEFELAALWSGTSFGFGVGLALVSACVLWYRSMTWHKKHAEIPKAPKDGQPLKIRQVEDFCDDSVWSMMKTAQSIADAHKLVIQPIHLFAAFFTTASGGLVIARLGLTFDVMKNIVTSVLSQKIANPDSIELVKEALLQSFLVARNTDRRSIHAIDVLHAVIEQNQDMKDEMDAAGVSYDRFVDTLHWIRLQEQLVEDHHAFIRLALLKPDASMNRTMTAHSTPFLDHYGEDLTRAARHDVLFPLIGRDDEMEQLLRQFESGHRAVMLISEPGVGKRALIEGLAQRMVIEDVPEVLFDKRLVSVDVAQVLAGGDPQQAPERLLQIIREAESSGNIILVLQHLDALAKASSSGIDLSDVLSTDIEQGRLFVLATTTPSAWTTIIEPLRIQHTFRVLRIEEPTKEHAMELLYAKSGGIEYKTGSYFTIHSLEHAYESAKRYLKEQRLPESALQLLSEAATSVVGKKGKGAFVTADDIAAIVEEKTHIPAASIHSDEKQTLITLERKLATRVIGQQEAVKTVSQAMLRARMDVREQRKPMATFLFLGPTGVGKTELAKALAAEYIGNDQLFVRLDMSEYQLPASAQRLIGAPGDNRGGLLTERIRKQPFSLILLDELEKAHPDVLTLFLQVLDDGRLTDGIGRTVDFTNTIIIATSNAAAQNIQQYVQEGVAYDAMRRQLLEKDLAPYYKPEFLNRFDGVVVFRPLSLDEVEQIAWLQINALAKQIEQKGYVFRAEDEAVHWLAQEGFDPQFGVRPLKRFIQEHVETKIAELMLKEELQRKDRIILEKGGNLRHESWRG